MATATIYCGTNSGYVQSISNVSYAAARAGGTLTLNTNVIAGAYAAHGQSFSTPTYYVMEAFLEFSLAAIPSGSTVTVPVLSLKDESNNYYTPTDFQIQALANDHGSALSTADFVAGADLAAKTLLAHLTSTSTWSDATYMDLTDDAMIAAIEAAAGGNLRMMLVSEKTRTGSGTAPTQDEFITPNAGNGSAQARLVFDYTAPAGGGAGSGSDLRHPRNLRSLRSLRS